MVFKLNAGSLVVNSAPSNIGPLEQVAKALSELRMLVALESEQGVFVDADLEEIAYELKYICRRRDISFELSASFAIVESKRNFDLLVISANNVAEVLKSKPMLTDCAVYVWPTLSGVNLATIRGMSGCEVLGNLIVFGPKILPAIKRISLMFQQAEGGYFVDSRAIIFDLTHRATVFQEYSSMALKIQEQLKQLEELEALREYKFNAEKKLVILRKFHLPRLIKGFFKGND